MSPSRPADVGVRLANAILCLAIGWLALLLLAQTGLVSWHISRSVVAFLAAIGVCAIGLALPAQWKVNFALVVGSLGFSLYTVELGLFIAKREMFRGLGRSTVLESLTKQGIDAYSIVPPKWFIGSDGVEVEGLKVFPLSGVAGKTTLFCQEAGPPVVYQSDRYGFNNPDDAHTSGPDIILIGDSYAHGACVKGSSDTAGRLRGRGWKVLNFGYSGNGPLLELATLTEYAAPLQPGAVVWLYYEGNDLRDLAEEMRSPTLRKYLAAGFSQGLMIRRAALVRPMQQAALKLKEAQATWLNSRPGVIFRLMSLRHLVSTTFWRLPVVGGTAFEEHNAEVLETFREALATARSAVAAWGGKLYFVYLPDSFRYRRGVDQEKLHQRSKVLAIVQSLQIPIIDFHQTVQALNNPGGIYPYAGAHFSERGYAELAGAIDAALRPGATR